MRIPFRMLHCVMARRSASRSFSLPHFRMSFGLPFLWREETPLLDQFQRQHTVQLMSFPHHKSQLHPMGPDLGDSIRNQKGLRTTPYKIKVLRTGIIERHSELDQPKKRFERRPQHCLTFRFHLTRSRKGKTLAGPPFLHGLGGFPVGLSELQSMQMPWCEKLLGLYRSRERNAMHWCKKKR